jgi:hypothetical protein
MPERETIERAHKDAREGGATPLMTGSAWRA